MTSNTRNRRFGRMTALAASAIAIGALAVPFHSAKAQWVGVDIGGIGIGVGAPAPYYYSPYYGGPYYHHYYHHRYYGPGPYGWDW